MIIFSDDINDKRNDDLSKRVDTAYDYIKYMKEQLEFWARNRTREISDADKKITAANERIAENSEAIDDLEPRIAAYETDIELGNIISVNKPMSAAAYRNANNDAVYPPKVTRGSITDSDNVTTHYVIREYSNEYKEIYAAAIFKLNLSATYGALYYNDPNLSIPTSFFTEGNGDIYFMSSARSSQGIFSTNAHTWSSSTGTVAVFVGSPVKPSSGTWNVEVYIHGAKF